MACGKQVVYNLFFWCEGEESARQPGKQARSFVGMKDLIRSVRKVFKVLKRRIATPGSSGIGAEIGEGAWAAWANAESADRTVTDDTAKAVREVKAGRI